MSLVTGFNAMVFDSVETLRRSLETNDLGDALQAAAEIVPFKVTGAGDLEQVRERSALVDQLILVLPQNALDMVRKLLSVVHKLVPLRASIPTSPGRTPNWIKNYQQWVGEVHGRRMSLLRDRFPVLFLQHMKGCDFGCGSVQVFQQIVSSQDPRRVSEEFCRGGIELFEQLRPIKDMQRAGWKDLVQGLLAMSNLSVFPEVYFDHTLKCTKKCGSWRVFVAVAQRDEPLNASTLRKAFAVLSKVNLRQAGREISSQVVECKGLQLLLPHVSRLEPEDVRTRLLGALFRQVAAQKLARTLAKPFLSYTAPLFVSKLPSAEEIGLKEFMCDKVTLMKIIRHAEWRVKFMLKLLVAIYKDGRVYGWEKACLQYGRKEGDLVQCHSAIISSVVYRERKGGGTSFLARKGMGFTR